MNENKIPDIKKGEEIDLVLLLALLGKGLTKIKMFILSILKFVLSLIVEISKMILNGWKVILGVLLIAFTIGYFTEKSMEAVYSSEMLVKPYYNTRYQLVTSIEYFNALISEEKTEELEAVFNPNKDSNFNVKDILEFKFDRGPETENERIIEYQSFIKKLDSTSEQTVSFDDFIENRSIYTGALFSIKAYSSRRDIFKKLENGVLSVFESEFSKEQFSKEQKIRESQKQNILLQLKTIDSLKKFYINVRLNESQVAAKQISLGNLSLSSDNNVSTTKEYQLLEKENILSEKINNLEQDRIRNNKICDVVSGFQSLGNKESSLFQKYSIIFPLLALILLCLIVILMKAIEFVNNYEK